MDIIREGPRRMTLEAFADLHGLKMKVLERTRTDLHPSFKYERMRFCAHFDNVDVKEGGCLGSHHGNGGTDGEAMAEYARNISGKCLVIDAWKPESRKEIYAPELYVAL